VKHVVDRFLGDDVVVVTRIMKDSGSGGAVQDLYPKLINLKIMDEDSKRANCSLHGLQKLLENPSKNTMGNQGMVCSTPFQILYVLSLLMKTIREKGGRVLLNTLWAIAHKEIRINSKWKSQAEEKFVQAWLLFVEKVESFDDSGDGCLDSMLKFMTEAPNDIQDPVWT